MNYINELLEIGMNTVIDMSTDKVILEDEVYKTDIKDLEEIYNRLIDTLTEEQKLLLEDYTACIMSANERACNLTYLVGAKNTIRFLAETNVLKNNR